MPGERADDRRIFRITGTDRVKFLQGLVTNDVSRIKDGIVYAAILTPQGKYLADFFLVPEGDDILLDVKDVIAADLLQRLRMYKLRSAVDIEDTDLVVSRGLGDAPDGAMADPRSPTLGWRLYGDVPGDAPKIDWDALRVASCVPETGVELIPNDTFVLEAGLHRLGGVDFRKGCYVGQEVTARMMHKTELRKGLARVEVQGAAPVGTEITNDGKAAGTLYTQADGGGIAYLRFDRAKGDMNAGEAVVRHSS